MLKLYYANIGLLDDEQVFQRIFEKVNIQRREKILRCKQEKDKQRSLLVGYLLRKALEQEDIDYETSSISTLKNGKPVMIENSDLYFSLSHAGDYAACIISNYCVGVDIETKTKQLFLEEKRDRLDIVAQKILTKREWELYNLTQKEEKIELFLQFWTRKESYSKADGRGLGIDLSQIETDAYAFFSKWLNKDTMLSIYVEDGNFSDLQIEEIRGL